MNSDATIADAFYAAANGLADARPVTRAVPEIIRQDMTKKAAFLVTRYGGNNAWLAEALALFNVRSLSRAQTQDMVSALFPALRPVDNVDAQALASCSARIGRYGFSFPQWRFLAQALSGPSLLERYGMTRLARDTDIRNAALPPSDPNRDLYGAGFVKEDGAWTVEYRRAYILCACRAPGREVALLIRNSSYFFGRDRLHHPVYISWQGLTREHLRALDERSFAGNGSLFTPYQAAMITAEKIGRLREALDYLDHADMDLSRWLRAEGAAHAEDFIRAAAARQAAQGKTAPPFYVAFIDAALPPWFPRAVRPAAPGVMREMEKMGGENEKLVFLSGPNGDFPLVPGLK